MGQFGGVHQRCVNAPPERKTEPLAVARGRFNLSIMSDEPIVLARADLPSSARSIPWGTTTPDGSNSISDYRDRVRFDRRELKRILDLYGAMVMAGEWRDDLDPWAVTRRENRVYGRGTADNKGQHSINLAALRAVRAARGGRLGFNAKFLVEMGEEIGSPDLNKVCVSLRDELKADLFLASDGPRLSAERPTIFLGCRGGLRIHLDVNLRDGGHHSGNWGGVLANPATILANAIATLVDGHGRLLLDQLKPPRLSNQIRSVLADVKVEPSADEPQLSDNWGEEGLSAAERLYAWNTLEVLAISSGNIDKPANAIPGQARAVLQLRFVVGTKFDSVVDSVRTHLRAHGFPMVEVSATQSFVASRTDFNSPWINWAAESIRQTTGKAPAVLPNFGGSLPNDVFSETLGMPTIWVPHSYPGCSQHAPDEHILLDLTEEALGIMAGLFWDLGEMPRPL